MQGTRIVQILHDEWSQICGWSDSMEKTGELMMGDEAPMSVAMPSDKAMTLIIYKNYHDHWVDKHEKKEVVRSPKYTKQE
jgi:hypothetical protein